jgi:hypothetical protein
MSCYLKIQQGRPHVGQRKVLSGLGITGKYGPAIVIASRRVNCDPVSGVHHWKESVLYGVMGRRHDGRRRVDVRYV